MEIVLNYLLEESNLVRQSLKDKLSFLDFNTFTDEMLLEKEYLYTAMGLRSTSRSARCFDLDAKFIP